MPILKYFSKKAIKKIENEDAIKDHQIDCDDLGRWINIMTEASESGGLIETIV